MNKSAIWILPLVVAGMVAAAYIGVSMTKPTPDELYGCTIKQQMPNGDCP